MPSLTLEHNINFVLCIFSSFSPYISISFSVFLSLSLALSFWRLRKITHTLSIIYLSLSFFLTLFSFSVYCISLSLSLSLSLSHFSFCLTLCPVNYLSILFLFLFDFFLSFFLQVFYFSLSLTHSIEHTDTCFSRYNTLSVKKNRVGKLIASFFLLLREKKWCESNRVKRPDATSRSCCIHSITFKGKMWIEPCPIAITLATTSRCIYLELFSTWYVKKNVLFSSWRRV